MKNFHNLLASVTDIGVAQFNTRTNEHTKVNVGEQLVYEMSNGFPAVTSKKLYFDGMKGELLGFFRGYDNAAQFRELGCKIWDDNANKTPAWLANPNRKGTDDLGRIYGVQWTAWSDKRVVEAAQVQVMREKGYDVIAWLNRDYAQVMIADALMERKINQLENALRTILTNPSDRRIIISAWNPAEFDLMSLPPCHIDYRFVPFENTKTLNVVMTMRSADLFLGIPFNIASTALFLSIMAKLSGYTPGKVVVQMTNAHIYDNHTEQVAEQLSRTSFDLPKLGLSDNIKQISVDEIKGVFERIQPEDIWLEDYVSHSAIRAPMAA